MAVKGARPRRRAYGSLTRDEILDAAERMAVKDGTTGLTLRRLGRELGCDHTALFRYFPDKESLIEAVADRLLERRAGPPEGGDWRTAMSAQVRHAINRFAVHPDLARVIALRPSAGTSVAENIERALERLEQLGLSPEDAALMYEVTEGLIVGFGLYLSLLHWADTEGLTPDSDAERRALAALPPERYPHVTRAASHLYQDGEDVFEKVIEIVLDAVEHQAGIPPED